MRLAALFLFLAACTPTEGGLDPDVAANPCRGTVRVRSRGFGYYDDAGDVATARSAALEQASTNARRATAGAPSVQAYAAACDQAITAGLGHPATDADAPLFITTASANGRVPDWTRAAANPPIELEGRSAPFANAPTLREVAVELEATYSCACPGGSGGKGDGDLGLGGEELVDATEPSLCVELEQWATGLSCLSADDATYCTEQALYGGCSAWFCGNTCDGAPPELTANPPVETPAEPTQPDGRPVSCNNGTDPQTLVALDSYGTGVTQQDAIEACVTGVELGLDQIAFELGCSDAGGAFDVGYALRDEGVIPAELDGSWADIEGSVTVGCTVTPYCCY